METGLLCEIEDSPKEEDNLKNEGNLKKRMAKNVDNPEKENDPKHFAGRGGGPYNFVLFLQVSHSFERVFN